MTQIINVYCDESCHLENDAQGVMVLGAIWCPLDRTREISEHIREIKQANGLPKKFEIKWTKVSPAKQQFYLELMNYFFANDDLHFRALIVPDKRQLRHADFEQTHDDFYYKMYFDLLKVILSPSDRFCIYLDIKDTRGTTKVAKLNEVLSNSRYDFSRQIIERIQLVRSHEIELVQLADLLIGAVSYANRHLATSVAKTALVEQMRLRSGYTLERTTLLRENKVNLFRWKATEV